MAGGGTHSRALDADGIVSSWGEGAGQFGDATTTARSAPAPVPGISGASAIAAGTKHLLALLEEDR